MKIRGFLAILMLAAVIVVALQFVKTGGTAKIQQDVGTFSRAKAMLTETNFKTLSRAIDTHQATQGEMPARLDDLGMSLPLTTGKQDGWGRVIRYEIISETSFRLTSAGPDGRFDTTDDIIKEY